MRHADQREVILGTETSDQIANLAFCGFKSAWCYIRSLHTRRCLQNDDGVATERAGKKNCWSCQDEDDEDSRQQLEEEQRRNAQSLPGTTCLEVLQRLLPEQCAANDTFLPFRSHKIEQENDRYDDA